MKTNSTSLIACVGWFAAAACALAQGNAFTYQGKLNVGTNLATGFYDFKVTVFDLASGGGTVAGTKTNTGIAVGNNGLFALTLDLGAGVFTGNPRWLEVAVRTNGSGAFSTLTARQPVTAAPYAITASNLTGTLPAAQLTGTLGSAQLAGTYAGAVTFNNPANVFTGIGGGLTGLLPTNLIWGACPPWLTCGNAGTAGGVNFLGTIDNQLLEIRVNNTRALRVEPTASVPNWIGGGSASLTAPGTIGGTIGGGNGNALLSPAFATIGGGATNTVRSLSDYSTIGGGSANNINSIADRSTIGGGFGNIVSDHVGTVSGGQRNWIDWGDHAVIGGGMSNRAGYYATGTASFGAIGGGLENFTLNALGTIAGGRANRCGANVASFVDGYASAIAGGVSNSANGTLGSIGGGYANIISNNTVSACISGGQFNLVQSNASYSSIGGGLLNLTAGTNSTVGGGCSNTNYSDASTIAGGAFNSILANDGALDLRVGGYGSTIGGGLRNAINEGVSVDYGQFNTIAGGATNTIDGRSAESAVGDTIGGGVGNFLARRTSNCTIAGGTGNSVADGASSSSIGGGYSNAIDAIAATVGGGQNNKIDCYLFNGQTIAGGTDNLIGGNFADASYATIGGGRSNKVETAALYAVIPGGDSAKAYNRGQAAFASGRFATAGDAQTSTYVCRNTTTSATQTELFLDGVSQRMAIPPNSTWSFDALITGRAPGGNSSGYRILGCIKNNAGATALVGSVVVTTMGEDVPAWDATCAADNTNDALVVRVTGAASTTIRWVANVRVVEVSF